MTVGWAIEAGGSAAGCHLNPCLVWRMGQRVLVELWVAGIGPRSSSLGVRGKFLLDEYCGYETHCQSRTLASETPSGSRESPSSRTVNSSSTCISISRVSAIVSAEPYQR